MCFGRVPGIAAVAIVAASVGACRNERARTSPAVISGRPIVLITIDTLRADRLGSYGSARALTPALDRFAQGATRFTAAVTQAPLTLPAHATILTGLHPARHGVRTNDGFKLGGNVPVVSDVLHQHGYVTGAFIGGYPLQASFGLARGFDRYDDEFLRSAGVVERRADEVVDSALAWISQRRTRSFFAWIHLFDPHSPYSPPDRFASSAPGVAYDGEVAYTDAAVGRLFDRLAQLDLFTRSTIIVVADHGESLGDHGERTHGTFLYDATVRVPLLVKAGDGGGTEEGRRSVVDVPVELADLAPTIAELAGASMSGVDGRSLLPLVIPSGGAKGDPERPAYSESYYQNILLGWSPLRAVRTARWKFIEAPRPELYDLDQDPAELHNRIDERSSLAAGLQRALPVATPATPSDPAHASTSEASERLRSLGYVSGSTVQRPGVGPVNPKDRVEVWAAIEDGIDRVARHPAAAEQAFRRALQLDPANGLVMKYLADIDFRAGRLQAARDRYRRAIDAGFRHADVFVNLASIAEREGRLDEARAALNDAVRISPADADAWNRLGLLDAQRGDLSAARRAFGSAMNAAPDRAEPYYNLGVVERRSGNEAAAVSRFQDALARNPSYAEAHYELGTGLLAAKRPDRALQEYRAALGSKPDYVEALFGAAGAALDLGRTDEARRDYERFVQIAPREYRQQVAAAEDALRKLAAPRQNR